jgi:NADH:ubiquinone oxidoreductase subunit 2 (subunit N)
VLTATVGNTGALAQNNIKRMLAYSSIAHAGYMLCALSLLVKTGDQDVANAAAGAILLYLAIYLFMNLGAFTVAGIDLSRYRQRGHQRLRRARPPQPRLGRVHGASWSASSACRPSRASWPSST